MKRGFVIAGLNVTAAAAACAAFIAWQTAQPTFAADSNSSESTATSPAPQQPPFIAQQTPRPLPPLNFVNGAGEAMTLADFHGRVVLLNVWATWCVPCRKEMPTLDRLQAQLGGSDFAVVPLSIDFRGRDVVERFYRELELKSLGVYVDQSGNATSAIKVFGMPTTLLVDREGRELGRVIGPADWDGAAMISRIKGYLATPQRQIRADAATSDAAAQ